MPARLWRLTLGEPLQVNTGNQCTLGGTVYQQLTAPAPGKCH